MHEKPELITAYIGLGSNLGDSVATLESARNALAKLSGSDLLRCAGYYKSAPVGTIAQPDFINSVCALATTLTPQELLHLLMEIEKEFGRQRSGISGGPRTLDLDLLLYGNQSLKTDRLTLPHPRLHERAFVLYPLDEVAPDLVIPGLGSVKQLVRNCADQRIEPVADSR